MSTPADVHISDIALDTSMANIQHLRQQIRALWGTTAGQGEAQHALELTTFLMRNGYTGLACTVAATTGYTGNDNVIGLLNQGKKHLASEMSKQLMPHQNDLAGSLNLAPWDPPSAFQALDPVTAYAARLRDVGTHQKDDQWFPAGATVNQVNAKLAEMAAANGDSNPLVYGNFADPPNNSQSAAHGPYDLPGWDPNKPWVPVNQNAPDFGINPSQSAAASSTSNPLESGAAAVSAQGGASSSSTASTSANTSAANTNQNQNPLGAQSSNTGVPATVSNSATNTQVTPTSDESSGLTTGQSDSSVTSSDVITPENLIAGTPSPTDVNRNVALNVTDPLNQNHNQTDNVIGHPGQPADDMGMNFDPTPKDKMS